MISSIVYLITCIFNDKSYYVTALVMSLLTQVLLAEQEEYNAVVGVIIILINL